MTTARIPARRATSTAVALLLPGQPLPPPWCIDPSMPACDLCDRPTEQLWPLATVPAEDELLAGRTADLPHLCRGHPPCTPQQPQQQHHHHHHHPRGIRRPNRVRSGHYAHPHVLNTHLEER